MGAKAAIIQPDEKIFNYLKLTTNKTYKIVKLDKDTEYGKIFDFNVEDIEPQVSCPDKVDNVKPISQVIGVNIDQAVLGSCTNGRLEDLAIASSILKDKRISKNVRMIVIPASRLVYLDAIKKGYIENFLKSGATIINPGCGPCLGLHEGVVGKGETVLSSTNRNFKGRMGSSEAKIYLASPATVAISALRGEISDPREKIK
jgi:3-isopropylmalate/(R)-2-methylmalate dehydratase large subunit